MKKYKNLEAVRERERERELYSNKIIKIGARIAFTCDNKKQADYI